MCFVWSFVHAVLRIGARTVTSPVVPTTEKGSKALPPEYSKLNRRACVLTLRAYNYA